MSFLETHDREDPNTLLEQIDLTAKPVKALFADNSIILFEPKDKKNAAMFEGLKFIPDNHIPDGMPQTTTKSQNPGVQHRFLVKPPKGPQFYLPRHVPKHYVQTCIERIEKGV